MEMNISRTMYFKLLHWHPCLSTTGKRDTFLVLWTMTLTRKLDQLIPKNLWIKHLHLTHKCITTISIRVLKNIKILFIKTMILTIISTQLEIKYIKSTNQQTTISIIYIYNNLMTKLKCSILLIDSQTKLIVHIKIKTQKICLFLWIIRE